MQLRSSPQLSRLCLTVVTRAGDLSLVVKNKLKCKHSFQTNNEGWKQARQNHGTGLLSDCSVSCRSQCEGKGNVFPAHVGLITKHGREHSESPTLNAEWSGPWYSPSGYPPPETSFQPRKASFPLKLIYVVPENLNSERHLRWFIEEEKPKLKLKIRMKHFENDRIYYTVSFTCICWNWSFLLLEQFCKWTFYTAHPDTCTSYSALHLWWWWEVTITGERSPSKVTITGERDREVFKC